MKTMKFDLQKDYRIEISKPWHIHCVCVNSKLYTPCMEPWASNKVHKIYEGVSNQRKMNNKDKNVSFYKTANEQLTKRFMYSITCSWEILNLKQHLCL